MFYIKKNWAFSFFKLFLKSINIFIRRQIFSGFNKIFLLKNILERIIIFFFNFKKEFKMSTTLTSMVSFSSPIVLSQITKTFSSFTSTGASSISSSALSSLAQCSNQLSCDAVTQKNLMKDFSKCQLVINQDEIFSKIKAIAQRIDLEYQNKEVVIVMIMKGAFVFVADLIREITIPCNIETIKCSSYGQKGVQRQDLSIEGLDKLNLENKNVIVADDIFDSGHTLDKVMREILKKKPASLKSLIALLKNNPKRKSDVALPDFYLFQIENKFVIGYGLDYKERYRGLKGIYYIEENK